MGVSSATKRAPASPLAGFDVRADDRATWKVGMIHGSRTIPGLVESDDVIFTDAEVADSGLDYLALGHWHNYSTGRAGGTIWAYAGAPEPVAVDQDGAGSVLPGPAGGAERRPTRAGAAGASGPHGLPRRVGRCRRGRERGRSSSRDCVSWGTPTWSWMSVVDGIAPDTLELDLDEVERALAGAFLHVRRPRPLGYRAGGWAGPARATPWPARFVADVARSHRGRGGRG